MTTPTTTIDCPQCDGHGGEYVYCDECLSTGQLTVTGVIAEAIEILRADLAAVTARAEAAERDAADVRRWTSDVRRWADAVPVEALIRYCEHAQVSGYRGALSDVKKINAWIERQGKAQP